MKQLKRAKPPKQAFHRQLVGYAWTETAVTSEPATKQKRRIQSNEITGKIIRTKMKSTNH